MHARDSRSTRAHTQQRVCVRVPPFRALVPLAGALFDISLPFDYRVAAFEHLTNGTREPSPARAPVAKHTHAARCSAPAAGSPLAAAPLAAALLIAPALAAAVLAAATSADALAAVALSAAALAVAALAAAAHAAAALAAAALDILISHRPIMYFDRHSTLFAFGYRPRWIG